MRGPFAVYLIDDHPVVAAGLQLAFAACADLRLVGVALDPAKGLDEVALLRPDAVILDLVYHGCIEIAATRECRRLLPDAVLLVFTSLAPDLCEQECRDAGANVLVSKSEDPRRLAQILSQVLHGGQAPIAASRRAGRLVLASLGGIELTARETDVAAGLAAGRSVRQIAEFLGLSAKTVAIHRDNLKVKLRCRSSYALTALLARLPELQTIRTVALEDKGQGDDQSGALPSGRLPAP